MDSIPEWKFQRWISFLNLEPQGGKRGDLQAGIIASTVANVNRKRFTPPYKAKEFMPKFDYERLAPRKQQTVEELKSNLFRIHNAHKKIFHRSKWKSRKKRKKDEENKPKEGEGL